MEGGVRHLSGIRCPNVVHWTPDQMVWVLALAGVMVLCT